MGHKIKVICLAVCASGFLSACDVYSGVSEVGNEEYMLTEMDMKIGLGAVRPVIVSSVHKRADTFCSEKGLQDEKIESKFENARVGSVASYTLIFRCS